MWAELSERQDLSCVLACFLQSGIDEYVLSIKYGPNKASNVRVSRAEQDEELCCSGKSNRDKLSRSSETEALYVSMLCG